MNWGDIPGWVGAGLGIGALIVAWVRPKRAQRAAERSATAAEESKSIAQRALELQEESWAAQQRAAQPRPSFRIERVGHLEFCLRNVGDATAEGVKLAEVPQGIRGWGTTTLKPNEASKFLIVTAMGRPAPTALYVTWEGLPEPVAVAVP